MTPAAFRATYSDWKLIRTRGVVQVVMELPIEKADEAYRVLGGMPNPAHERWFAIAALNHEGEAPVPLVSGHSGSAQTASASPHREPSSRKPMTMAQQAGACCHDLKFQEYLFDVMALNTVVSTARNEITAANFVRGICEVSSRAEILPGTPAGDKWKELHDAFTLWRDYPEMARATK